MLLLAAGLLLVSRLAPDRFDDWRGESADLVAPVWGTLGRPIDWVSRAAENVGAYFNAANRLRRIENRERVYRQRRARYEQAEAENRQLKRLLSVVDPGRERVGVFAVAGASGGPYQRQAIVSGGRRHGVLPGQPVMSADGLIGRTVAVGDRAARVMLVTDVSSRVPVRVVRTGLPALVIGTNEPLVDVDLTGPTTNIVEIGDRLVTSGDGGLFPPGIPVATVVRALGDMPRARPEAVPAGMRYVLVERPYMPSPEEGEGPLEALDAPVEALPRIPAPADEEILQGQDGAPAP